MLGVCAGGVAGMGLARHGLARQATPAAGWSFTDDKGVTVTLDAAPQRLAIDLNAAAALWDFGVRPAAVFGWDAKETGDFGDAGGNIDPSTVEVAGNTAEPVQLEKMVAAKPDLIVTLTFTAEDDDQYWSIDPEIVEQVRDIAPIVALSATGTASANIARHAELAAALGADPDAPEVVEARQRYEAAVADLDAAAQEKADISVLFINVQSDTAYVANPEPWSDLGYYLASGVNIINPDIDDAESWLEISPEQALEYASDVFMAATIEGTLTIDEIVAHPTFGQHPAVKAGQIADWNQSFIQSYQGGAEAFEHLAATLREATKVT
jgi:iron complex transport system substrate-binding protein